MSHHSNSQEPCFEIIESKSDKGKNPLRIPLKRIEPIRKRFKRIEEESKSQIIKNLYNKYFIETVLIYLTRKVFPYLKTENCYGCSVNHPSQRQHMSLMRDNEEWWNLYGTEALQKIEFYLVYFLCRNRLYEHFRQTEVDNAIETYVNEEDYINNEEWVNKIKSKVLEN